MIESLDMPKEVQGVIASHLDADIRRKVFDDDVVQYAKLEEDKQLHSMSPIRQKIRDTLDAFNKNLGPNYFTAGGYQMDSVDDRVRPGNRLTQWPAIWVHHTSEDGDLPSVPTISLTQRFVDSIRDAGIECTWLTNGHEGDTTISVPLGTTARCEYTLNIVEESHTIMYESFTECRHLEFVMTFPDKRQCELNITMEDEDIPGSFELVINLLGNGWNKDLWDERARDIVLFAHTVLSVQDEPYTQFVVVSPTYSRTFDRATYLHSRCAQWGLRLRR